VGGGVAMRAMAFLGAGARHAVPSARGRANTRVNKCCPGKIPKPQRAPGARSASIRRYRCRTRAVAATRISNASPREKILQLSEYATAIGWHAYRPGRRELSWDAVALGRPTGQHLPGPLGAYELAGCRPAPLWAVPPGLGSTVGPAEQIYLEILGIMPGFTRCCPWPATGHSASCPVFGTSLRVQRSPPLGGTAEDRKIIWI
jgi:hypothetical protein